MSNRHHLPAGQNIHGSPATAMSNVDMHSGPGPAGAPRRRQHQYMPQYHQQPHQHQHQHQHQPQHMNPPMYPQYNPYAAPPQYYGMPPQYQNGAAMPGPGYMPYPPYGRSPQPMHQYAPMVGVTVPPQNYPRPSPHSPSLATPYQPPVQAPLPPQTPSSSHSSQMPPPPTPPTPQSKEPVYTAPNPAPVGASPVVPPQALPFRPPLPWTSHPESDFPTRSSRRQPRQSLLNADSEPVSFRPQYVERRVRPVRPQEPAAAADIAPAEQVLEAEATHAVAVGDGQKEVVADQEQAPVAAVPRVPAPSSWAKLFAKTPVAQVMGTNGSTVDDQSSAAADSDAAPVPTEVVGAPFVKPNVNSVAEAINAYRVKAPESIPFLEPRGLINTGNMCYMNSVLQVLMFCVPFYDFLDQVGKRAAHSFKSDTPLLDAMIMFMHEYKVVRSAATDEQLRKAIRPEEIDRHGDPFTPEFVYEAIRLLSRFASMRRGHQQDAEEFLGFLLQSLDDECTHVMSTVSSTADVSETSSQDGAAEATGDWLEVGRKQKAAVTRSSGSNSSTPITKIFGGLLRSEFRVPGLKDSITTEPYQPLQLDIGSPDVRNVVDALRGLTRPERIQGDFNSPRGKDVTATKQLYIETLPPVLILHLKRFQFNTEGGTTKIWKKIGYPLELEIPREILSRQTRQSLNDTGAPKYRLISVVYHHGKNASGGHYTVDVRRQEGREWLNMDDTVLKRVRSEDVAEMGSEEEVKEHRRDQSNGGATPAVTNRFGAMNDEDEGDDEDGWSQVPTAASGQGKRWSNVVNGSPNGASTKEKHRENYKDNRVAYLLFYQRI